jgi:uncharacterized protein (TIGR02722 family)
VSDGTWGAQEVQTVCSELIAKCLNSPSVDRTVSAKTKGSKRPTVIVGKFANDSSEYIDTSIVASKIETAIINDGRLSFVAGGDVRENLRGERRDQQANSSEKTAAKLANETGADFMMNGSVKSIVKQVGNTTSRSYFVYGQLTNIETNEIIWKGDSEVATLAKSGRVRL